MEDGDTLVQVLHQGAADFLVVVADDVGHLGGVHAVEHAVQSQGGDVQCHQAVEGGVDGLEGQGHGHHYDQVHGQQQLAHRQPLEYQLEKPSGQVGAAGGGALLEHKAQGQAHEQAAEDTGQQRLHGLPVIQGGENVDEHRGDEHGVQRQHQQPPANELPAKDKQGDVEHDHRHTYGAGGDEVVVGGKAPHEAQRVDGGGEGDDQNGPQIFLYIHSFSLLQQRQLRLATVLFL